MIPYDPPILPQIADNIEPKMGAAIWHRRFLSAGLVCTASVILGIVFINLFEKDTFLWQLSIPMMIFGVLLGIIAFLLMAVRSGGKNEALRLKASLLLVKDGHWHPHTIHGKRIEVDEKAVTVGAIAGTVVSNRVGAKVANAIGARGRYHDGWFPFPINLRGMIKVRPMDNTSAKKFMALSPDPRNDARYHQMWILVHPDCEYGIAETFFADCQLNNPQPNDG